MKDMPKYPEHEKFDEDHGAIIRFLEFLDERGYDVRRFNESPVSFHDIVAEYYAIDRFKLEKEKQQMLEEIRRVQDES